MVTIEGKEVELTNLDKVFFEGEKVKGGYALIRMQRPPAAPLRVGEDQSNWLLIKLKDEYVGCLPEDLEDQPQSVTTGGTLKDLPAPTKAKRM